MKNKLIKTLTSLALVLTFQPAFSANKISFALDEALSKPIVFGSRSATPKINNDVLADVVFFHVSDSLVERLKSSGIDVKFISKKYSRASILLSGSDDAEKLSSFPEVQHIYLERGFSTRNGSVTSRAATAMGARSELIERQGLSGKGVSIGIISDSFKRTAAVYNASTNSIYPDWKSGLMSGAINQISGDLPNEIMILDDNSRTSVIDEGAAMAELIYDTSPEASLFFHTSGDSIIEFSEAIDHLCQPAGGTHSDAKDPINAAKYDMHIDDTFDMDIVVDDIFFYSQLIYQDDIIAQSAADCVSSGVHYFSAAGNEGDSAFRSQFKDINPAVNNEGNGNLAAIMNDFHDWGNSDDRMAITIAPNSEITAILHWNQPALSAQRNKINPPKIDLNLYLLGSDSEYLDLGRGTTGKELQDGSINSADPVEYASYANNSSTPKTIYLAIEHFSGQRNGLPQNTNTKLEFTLLIFANDDTVYEYEPSAPSMLGHTNAKGVNSVAAIPWWETEAYSMNDGPTAEIDPEPFTARGGVINKFFDRDGFFHRESVQVPTFSAVDGNKTTFFGEDADGDGHPNFFGTSAAAPNAAGVAALLLETASYTPKELTDALACSAIDVKGYRAKPGPDDVTGAGLINPSLPLIDFIGETEVIVGKNINIDTMISDSKYEVSSIEWSQISGPSIPLPTTDSFSMIAPSEEGEIVLNALVSNSCGLKTNKKLSIKIIPEIAETPILPPTANAGFDSTGYTFETIYLSGARSSDAEFEIVDYKWNQLSGPAVNISPVFNSFKDATFYATETGAYIFELTVTNSENLKSTDEVKVDISLRPTYPEESVDPSEPMEPTKPIKPVESESVVKASSGSSGGGSALWMILLLLPVFGKRRH